MARKTTLQQAADRRQEAEHKLAAIQAMTEAKAYERSLALLEAPQPVTVPWQEYPQYDDFSRYPTVFQGGYPWTTLEDRTEERYRPLYENAADLRMIRAAARKLKALFPVTIGALESLTNYVIGPGFEYEVQAKRPGMEAWAAKMQGVLDRFLDRNEFSGHLEREIHVNSREDGEQLLGLYWDGRDRKDVRVELIDPDYILQPADPKPIERMMGTQHKINYWWHGVHTTHDCQLKRDDVTRPLGYHLVFDRVGDQWDYLPSCRAELIKRNVGRSARRGVSDLHAVQRDLELEGKIRRNTAEGAAILAAIVMIRQHAEGTSKRTVENLVTDGATTNYDKQTVNGSRSTNVEQLRAGTIKDTPYGMTTTVGPLGTLRSPVYIEVAQYVLRIIGSRWNMPEYLISGDASNSNYASTLVSGLPFVKAREADQAFYAAHFESLIWKALRMYYEAGAMGNVSWQQLREGVTLKVDYPTPATNNRIEQIQVDETLNRIGIMSKRTIASDFGLNYDEEQKEINPTATDGSTNAEQLSLNGLQVTAASEILHQVSAGETAELVALGLLQGIGIPPAMAGQMVKAAAAKQGQIAAQRPVPPQFADNQFPPKDGPPQNGPPQPTGGKPFGESEDSSGEHWITINGQHVQVSGDGEALTGAMKGTKLGSGSGGKEVGGLDSGHLSSLTSAATPEASKSLRKAMRGKTYTQKMQIRNWLRDKSHSSADAKNRQHYAKLVLVAGQAVSESQQFESEDYSLAVRAMERLMEGHA